MTTRQIEKAIAQKMKEIARICRDNDINYLSLSVINYIVSFNTEYWEESEKHKINYNECRCGKYEENKNR